MTCQTVEKGGGKRKVRLKHGKEARKEETQRKVTGQREGGSRVAGSVGTLRQGRGLQLPSLR